MAATAAFEHDSPAAVTGVQASVACVPWRALAADTRDWNRLADRASEPNPFYESWFLLPALELFAGAGQVDLLCFTDCGTLRGLLPVARSRRYYRWPLPNIGNWLHANCFLGIPLIERGYEAAFWRAALQWADRNPGLALFWHLRDMALDGPVYAGLESALAGTRRRAPLVRQAERAFLQSDMRQAAYIEDSLSAKKRKEFRRQANRLAELGTVTFERSQDADGIDPWTTRFLTLERGGWKGREGSALACDGATERLFRETLARAAQDGKLERLALNLDGKPVAMLATFLTGRGAFSFKTAFDEGYARFSPGVLLQLENLALLDREDIDWADSCAAADHPMIDRIWRQRKRVGSLSIAIGGPVRRRVFEQIVRRELARLRTKGVS